MKKVMITSLALMLSSTAIAQEVTEDGSMVVLPLEAQQCDLPGAPPPIPENADKAALLGAQKNVKQFQADMEAYRACVNKDAESGELTTGNLVAINNAHNYSVEMEERVAAMFNEAVKAYKARQSK